MASCKRSPGSPCSKSNNNNKEQDKFLPIANVGRIMKKVIPGNGKISKDAKETVQECVSEFISFITGEASDKCQREKRKTINGDDIIWAITTLGFDEYVEPLKQYLLKYRELEGDKSSSAVNNLPKQQQQQQQQYHDQQKQPIPHFPNYDPTATSSSSVYSSPSATSLLSQPLPFMSADQPFPSPFPPNSIQTTQHIAALHQQDRFDSLGHW